MAQYLSENFSKKLRFHRSEVVEWCEPAQAALARLEVADVRKHFVAAIFAARDRAKTLNQECV